MIRLAPLAAAAPDAVEALLDAAFGPDRHRRTAYLLRAGASPIAALSTSAWDGDRLIGVLQSWPVTLAIPDDSVPMVLVGPVAVAPDAQNVGIGRLMMRALLAASATGAEPTSDIMTMIGDPEYYAQFGFTADETGGWTLPGPWEPHRLLARVRSRRGRGLSGGLAPARAIA